MESRIVQIETATDICSVALTNNGELLAYRESQIKNSHSNLITIFINEVLEEASISFSDIDAIAVSGGPGSYTGIRIGMAVAKGIAFALDKPLIKICTLQALAAAAKIEIEEASHSSNELVFVPLIDARRMEAFTAFYSYADLKELEEPKAKIIDIEFFNAFLPSKKIVFVGNATNKCQQFFEENLKEIKKKEHQFLNIACSAKWLTKLAFRAFTDKNFVNLQATTADYYKNFYTQTKLVKN